MLPPADTSAVASERARVVAEARAWLGTPYFSNARVKGKDGGCDCLTLLAGVYENAGMIPPLEIPHYPSDWHLHRSDEHYLEGKDKTPGVMHFCREVKPSDDDFVPLPGDVMVFKFGRCYSHAAIVVDWPIVIHAWINVGVTLEDAERSPDLSRMYEDPEAPPRPRRLFRLKRWLPPLSSEAAGQTR